MPPSPYAPPPVDDSAAEEVDESEQEEAPPTTEPTTTKPSATRKSIRKKRKQLKRKLSALTGAKFRDKIQRRSSAKPQRKVNQQSAETYAVPPPENSAEKFSPNNPPVPNRMLATQFVGNSRPQVPRMPPPVRILFSDQSIETNPPRAHTHNRVSAPHAHAVRAPPSMINQAHATPAPNFPHSMSHDPTRLIAPAPAHHISPAVRNEHSNTLITSHGSPHQIVNNHDYQRSRYEATQQILSTPLLHSQYGALSSLGFPWSHAVPVINLTPQVVTTPSPRIRYAKPYSRPTERFMGLFRKRTSHPRSNDGIIKGHVHDHISFKKTFHMTLFKIPFLSIDVAKKVYKDESLVADLGKRTGEAYKPAHG